MGVYSYICLCVHVCVFIHLCVCVHTNINKCQRQCWLARLPRRSWAVRRVPEVDCFSRGFLAPGVCSPAVFSRLNLHYQSIATQTATRLFVTASLSVWYVKSYIPLSLIPPPILFSAILVLETSLGLHATQSFVLEPASGAPSLSLSTRAAPPLKTGWQLGACVRVVSPATRGEAPCTRRVDISRKTTEKLLFCCVCQRSPVFRGKQARRKRKKKRQQQFCQFETLVHGINS